MQVPCERSCKHFIKLANIVPESYSEINARPCRKLAGLAGSQVTYLFIAQFFRFYFCISYFLLQELYSVLNDLCMCNRARESEFKILL